MYVIGKYYEVPCVKTTAEQFVGRGEWVPIIGPLHEDAVIIDFPLLHWHVDWRFASSRQIQRLKVYNIDYLFAFPVQQRGIGPDQQLHVVEGPVPRRMRCKRKMPHFPRDLVSWLPQLEAAYAGCTMKNMICPHRGLPLVDCEQKDGVVTCPGHGLRWNIATGKLHTSR